MAEKIRWPNMARRQLVDTLGQKGFSVSVIVVDKRFKNNDVEALKLLKTVVDGQVKTGMNSSKLLHK
jgi:hypothetical protein